LVAVSSIFHIENASAFLFVGSYTDSIISPIPVPSSPTNFIAEDHVNHPSMELRIYLSPNTNGKCQRVLPFMEYSNSTLGALFHGIH